MEFRIAGVQGIRCVSGPSYYTALSNNSHVRITLLLIFLVLYPLVPGRDNPSCMILCFTCLFIIPVEPHNNFVK